MVNIVSRRCRFEAYKFDSDNLTGLARFCMNRKISFAIEYCDNPECCEEIHAEVNKMPMDEGDWVIYDPESREADVVNDDCFQNRFEVESR
jgi:hypothetical protein